jgi:HPt (histidine-containing phosphotransfer) domain-containing protein
VFENQFEQIIAPLRYNYVVKLIEKERDIAVVIDRIMSDGNCDPDMAYNLRQEIHRIRGVAPTFGFHNLGAIATRAEKPLECFTSERDQTDRNEIINALMALQNEIKSLAMENGSHLP